MIVHIVTGSLLLVSTAEPTGSLTGWDVIHYQTAFYSLTVSHNILCTLFIAGRMWYHQRTVQTLTTSGGWTYSAVIAVVVESAALYSICGAIYIPLVVRMIPLQYPITALIGALTVRCLPLHTPHALLTITLQSIAPNLIILRIALGKSFTVDTTARSLPQSTEFKLSALRSPQDSVVTDPLSSTTAKSLSSRTTLAGTTGRDVWSSDLKGSQLRSVIDPDQSV